MKIVCPECQSQFPISAGFFDADGKKLAIALAGAEPALGRAIVQYLALHKPLKTVLRLAKAAKLAEEVIALASAGEVCRGGLRRPAPVSAWAQAIESMLDGRAKLRLPLSGHGYLTEVAFAIADKADALAERQTHEHLRAGHRPAAASTRGAPVESRLANQLAWIAQQVLVGAMEPAEAERLRVEARDKYGAPA